MQRWFEGGKREPGIIAALAVWDKKRKSMCYRKRFIKHRTKTWKRTGFLCLATHRTTVSCRSLKRSVSGALMNTLEIPDQAPKDRLLTPVKEISRVHLR